MSEICVLDHGYVRPVDSMGTDETIIEAARMSTTGAFVSWAPYEGHPKGDAGLLDRLYRSGHSSPFEQCALSLEVQAPLFVVREWQRHRTFAFNELSARYAVMPDLHYLPTPERMQRQSTANRQGSAEPLPEHVAGYLIEQLRAQQARTYLDYGIALDYGLTRELARINTPVSRYSRMRVMGNLRNWLHFLKLRLAPDAQWEIRQFAEAVAQLVAERWPRTWALFEEYDRHGKRYSRAEVQQHAALVEERDGLAIDKVRLREALTRLLAVADVSAVSEEDIAFAREALQ